MTSAVTAARADRLRLLRTALRADAVVSGALGAALAAGATALDGVLGVSRPWLLTVGLFLLVWAAALLFLAGRATPAPAAVWTVIGVNAVWAIDSLILAAGDWVDLTTPGTVLVIAQALGVTAFAAAQYAGLRRPTPRPRARPTT